jgi:peptidoglycan/LPS O-acetylase OafA/YrhL
MFFFTSGYLLVLNNHINSFNDIILFLRKRLLRIFPLYWLSLSGFLYIDPPNSLFYAIVHFFGLQLVFTNLGGAEIILWFIGCITVYYLIYPILIMKTPSNKTIILRSLAVFFVLLALRINLDFFNASIFAYFPIFVFGILISKNKLLLQRNLSKVRNVSLIFIPICFYWYFVTKPSNLSDSSQLIGRGLISTLSVHIPKVILGISIMFLFYWIANNYLKEPNIKNIISKCAIASYPVYLFHEFIVRYFNSYLALIVVIPILFIICYYIQTVYNKITSSLFSKRAIHSKEYYPSKNRLG